MGVNKRLGALLLCLCLTGAAAAEDLGPAAYAEPAVCVLTLSLAGAEEDDSHVWHLALDPAGTLVFTWTAEGEADRFLAVLTGSGGEAARTETDGFAWQVPETDLAAGEYTLSVSAFAGQAGAGSASLRLVLGAEEGQSGSGSSSQHGKPSGGRPKPTGGITPGQALTSAHAKGGGSLIPYDAVAPVLPEEASDTLVLGGTALAVTCGGAKVLAALSVDSLILSSDAAEAVWRVGLGALDTLRRSGLRTLVLRRGEETLTVDTAWEPAGASYARERAKGLVGDDFALVWDADGLRLTAEDRVYTMDGQPPLRAEEAS